MRAELGILVVHGIGEQQPGATLAQCAGPLFSTLNDVAEHTNDLDAVVFDSTELHPSHGPARSEWIITGEGTESRWIVAESRWADAFIPARLGRMLLWSLQYLALLLWRVFRSRLSRVKASIGDLRGRIEEADNIFGQMADILKTGEVDAYIATLPTENQGNARAFLERLLRLNETSKRILATYLSLGRLLSQQLSRSIGVFALLTWAAGPLLAVVSLVTLSPLIALLIVPLLVLLVIGRLIPGIGQYITRLAAALERSAGDAFVLTRNPVGRSTMVTQVRSDLCWLRKRADKVIVVAHSQGTVITDAVLSEPAIAAEVAAFVSYGAAIGFLIDSSANVAFDWTNVWASDDPVAPAPLDIEGVADFESHNARSILRDHTTYWDNREEFVLRVGEVAMRHAGRESVAAEMREIIERGTNLRRRRMSNVEVAKFAAVAGAGLVAATEPEVSRSIGAQISEWVAASAALWPDLVNDAAANVSAPPTRFHGALVLGGLILLAAWTVVTVAISLAKRREWLATLNDNLARKKRHYVLMHTAAFAPLVVGMGLVVIAGARLV